MTLEYQTDPEIAHQTQENILLHVLDERHGKKLRRIVHAVVRAVPELVCMMD